MKIILLQNVKNVGQAKEVVDVSDGFARNMLLSKGLARPADFAAVSQLEREKQAETNRVKMLQKKAASLVNRLRSLTIDIAVPGTAAGTLYAGLKESEILAKLMKSVSGLPAESRLAAYEPIKTAGDHEVNLELAPGVRAALKLKISADGKK